MDGPGRTSAGSGWTRARLLRAAIGGGAMVAGGAAVAARTDGGSLAAQSKAADAEILNFFLLLEYVQEGFYREAVRTGRLKGDLLTFARTVGEQESEHVAFLTERLGNRADARPTLNFEDALSTPDRFRKTAIELEEAALAGYVGQGANLSRDMVRPVATLVSVEARQAAWVRDLAGVSPAPRVADPARKADRVVADLRKRGFVA
jgi:hypothetical protein